MARTGRHAEAERARREQAARVVPCHSSSRRALSSLSWAARPPRGSRRTPGRSCARTRPRRRSRRPRRRGSTPRGDRVGRVRGQAPHGGVGPNGQGQAPPGLSGIVRAQHGARLAGRGLAAPGEEHAGIVGLHRDAAGIRQRPLRLDPDRRPGVAAIGAPEHLAVGAGEHARRAGPARWPCRARRGR